MRSRHLTALVLLAACVPAAGCHKHHHCCRGDYMAAPVVEPYFGPSPQGVMVPSAQSVPYLAGAVDGCSLDGCSLKGCKGLCGRHPLFTKPHEFCARAQGCCLHKAAAATLVGVPAGVVGEVKQIIHGCPPAPPPY